MTANISVSRGRGHRIPASNALKPPQSSQPAAATPTTPPSNVTLFLTNIRLLDLDLRDGWPEISAVTFSTKDAQQNQKKRIQCVEWALYQLFVIWDPEEARDKLKPFFPPLEHLQSLNLRAALFRCLDHAKKIGLLGRDAVLRKTMLDECKGDRLEEVLAVFSTAVLKKVIQERDDSCHTAIAKRLAMESFSYNDERTNLATLIMAHKSSLSRNLAVKQDFRARYNDFADLLNLRERQITRRHEQLKASVKEKLVNSISDNEAQILMDRVEKNWTGNSTWLETILHGDSSSETEDLLSTPFDTVWKHIEDGSIGDVEYQQRKGLLEQLDTRIRQQSHRLAKWQSFERTLVSNGNRKGGGGKDQDSEKRTKGVDLGFSAHESLQLIRSPLKAAGSRKPTPLSEYARLIDNLQVELSNVGKPRPHEAHPNRPDEDFMNESDTAPIVPQNPSEATPSPGREHCSASNSDDTDEESPRSENCVAKSLSQTPSLKRAADGEERLSETGSPHPTIDNDDEQFDATVAMLPAISPTSLHSDIHPPSPCSRTPSPLASEILASVLTTSPSPNKPRHVLSLAERTRMSMSRASLAKTSFQSEDTDDDLPELLSRPLQRKPQASLKSDTGEQTDVVEPSSSLNAHNRADDLTARTRQSMSNFAAVQKNTQVDRRRSVKAAARNKRESRSNYFPKPLKTAVEDEGVVLDGLDKKKLIEGEVEVDYEVVFKSRPRIKTSPERSPQRSPVKAWGEMGGRADVAGSSSPMSEEC